MYEKVVTVVAAFAALSSANPVALPASHPLLPRGAAPITDPRFTNFVAPGPNDVRSPCPGLNSLANHGFLHHDGRNMTIPHLIDGLAAGLNVGADFATAIGGVGLLSSPVPLLFGKARPETPCQDQMNRAVGRRRPVEGRDQFSLKDLFPAFSPASNGPGCLWVPAVWPAT